MPSRVYDVIVIGGGGAGLAAAIEARALGRDVLLLEKNPALGGSTAWSIGSISSSATPHQIKRGIKDCPADHWADMPAFAGALAPRDNDELRRILCDEIPQTFRWLLACSVRFYGPIAEPPHRKPRMHTVLPNSGSYIYHLQRHARRLGVEILTNTRAHELLSEGGRVCGARCGADANQREFRARGGVVLAAGDFTNSPELKARFMGPQEAKIEGVNPTATGDGQLMAEKLGARILNGDLALGPEIRFIAPARDTLVRLLPPWPALAVFMQWALEHLPQAILRPFLMSFLTTALAPSPSIFDNGAILINKQGRRFGDERERPAYALPDQPDQLAYILIDRRIATLFSAWPNFVSTAPGSPTPTFPTTAGVARTSTAKRTRSMNSRTSSACRPRRWAPPSPNTTVRFDPPITHARAFPIACRWSRRRSRRWARYAPCSCTTRAGSAWIPSTACSTRKRRRSPDSLPQDRPARAVCCSRAMVIILPGRSCPDAAPADSLPTTPFRGTCPDILRQTR